MQNFDIWISKSSKSIMYESLKSVVAQCLHHPHNREFMECHVRKSFRPWFSLSPSAVRPGWLAEVRATTQLPILLHDFCQDWSLAKLSRLKNDTFDECSDEYRCYPIELNISNKKTVYQNGIWLFALTPNDLLMLWNASDMLQTWTLD